MLQEDVLVRRRIRMGGENIVREVAVDRRAAAGVVDELLEQRHANPHGDRAFDLVTAGQLVDDVGWRRLDERPDPHALPPAPLAVGYLCVPADAQFIKALMRGILPAFWAKAVEPFAPVALTNCAAPGEVGHEGPNSERRKSMPPGIEARPAVTTHTPLDRDEAKSVKE